MIESGPAQATEAAWAELEQANARAVGMARTGVEHLDDALQEAHLDAIEEAAWQHLIALRGLRKARRKG